MTRPPIVDLDTWQAARDELLVREKAHTREGDAIAAARRRLPMVEIDGKAQVVGANGPVPFVELFDGRDELVVYQHMWWDGAPHQGQCEGCTLTPWHVQDASYLNARGVSFAILTVGAWDEVAPFVEFMGYRQPWYSVRDLPAPIGGDMGYFSVFLRDGEQVFLTYRTTGRGTERVVGSLGLLDMTPYGRGERWEDNPDGWLFLRGVGIEAGLLSSEDARLFVRSGLAHRCRRILIEPLDADPETALEHAARMERIVSAAAVAVEQVHHGYDLACWAVNRRGLDRGHGIRTGLEDVTVLPDGQPARDNAELVAAAAHLIRARGARGGETSALV